jgi:DNA polymerase (family 10)
MSERWDRLYVAEKLRDIANALALVEGRKFQAKAYARGAVVVESLDDAGLVRALREETLEEIPNIGRSPAKQIRSLATTGSSALLEKLEKEFPRAIVTLASVPGMSEKKARAVHDALGIETIDALVTPIRSWRAST